MANERFDVRAGVAVGTLDFVSGRPTFYDQGFSFQAACNGNFSLTVLATNLDPSSPSNFTDVTSMFGGAAAITANGWYRPTLPSMFGAVRINVGSLQAAKVLNLAGSWT